MPQVVCVCFVLMHGWSPVMLNKGCCAQAKARGRPGSCG